MLAIEPISAVRSGLALAKEAAAPGSVVDLVVRGLWLARGYAPADVQRIMGGNWLRLYDEVW